MHGAFDDGYHAGLTNDRECPHWLFTFASILWHLGNDVGVRAHCATVEAVYTRSEHD